jgi:phosphoribosylglycinamide formyltransferase-1
MKIKKIALFASGSGSNVENIYYYFKDRKDIEITMVLCNNPKAYVIERCKKLGISYILFDKSQFYQTDYVVDILKKSNIDLIVLAGFLWLVPKKMVEAFPQKIINIHPALLPKYGGKGMYGNHVHEAVLANGEKETGITIHYVNEHYDEGAVIFQAKVEIQTGLDANEIAKAVQKLEYEYYPKVIDRLLS